MLFEAFKKYAVFCGRARRQEYWFFVLISTLIFIAAMLADAALGTGSAIFLLASLGLAVPSWAVTFRRLHDINVSGAWALLSLIPVLGSIVLLIMTLIDGTPGDNDHGADPKGRSAPVAPAEETAA